MPYGPIIQLGGGRKYSRFVFHNIVTDLWTSFSLHTKVSFKHTREGKERIMENGDLETITYGHRVLISLIVLNTEQSDVGTIQYLFQVCDEVDAKTGELYIYPNYDSQYTDDSQDKYLVLPTGDKEPKYTHAFLATMQEFKFNFKGKKYTSPMPKRVYISGDEIDGGGGIGV